MDELDEINEIVNGALAVDTPPNNTSQEGVSNEGNEGNGVNNEPPADGIANQEAEVNDTPNNQAGGASTPESPAQGQPQFDLITYLKEVSGGEIDSEEVLKERLSKYKGFESEITQLKSEKETLFANDYIKTLNNLHKEGKTSEQIAEFEKMYKLGDLGQLDPKEVLVQQEISNGYDRKTAERLIERKYGLDKIELNEEHQTSEDKDELDFINQRMKVDSESARKELQSKLDEIAKPMDPTEKALKEVSAKKEYQEKLKPFAQKLSEDFPKKLEFGEIEFEVPKEFADGLQDDAVNYFTDQEVNQDNINSFVSLKKAIFLAQNHEAIAKSLLEKGRELGRKDAEAEFTNNGGVGRQGSVLNDASQTMSDADVAAAAMRIAEQ